MKEFLQKLIANKKDEIRQAEANKVELEKRIDASNDIDELKRINGKARSLGETLVKLKEELDDAEKQLAELDKPADNGNTGGNSAPENDNGQRKFNPMSTVYKSNDGKGKEQREVECPRSSMEYRKAFMNYVQRGEMSSILEKRVADQFESKDLGVLLPETIVNEIIKDVEQVYGQLYARVKKTNFRGGVKYPLGSFTATFNRITETTVSERQAGGSVTGSVEFSYKIGEIRLATTLLASILEVPVFEQEFARIIVEAYVKAMDTEILIGTEENNQMVGILTEANKSGTSRIPTANIITFTTAQMAKWDEWKKRLFAKIPLSMRKERPTFYMTSNTFEANIETLQDSNGQPVARTITNPVNGDETARFFGREVVFVEPLDGAIENFDDAATGDYFGMYAVLDKGYAINTNLAFSVTRYFDQETNQYVDKAIVINDGKVLDPKYIYLLKKA